MKDISSAVLLHVRWLLSRMGSSRRQKALNALAVTFVSFCIPWVIGTRFLSAFTLIPLACLSVFLVADMMVDSFTASAGDEAELAGKAVACVLMGWFLGLTVLLLGLVALNILNWPDGLLTPRAEVLADALWLSIAACILVAGVTWQVAGRLSPAATRLGMKFAIVAVSILGVRGCNTWQTDGTFVLTTHVITLISVFAGAGMCAIGVALLALPSGPKRSTSR